MVHFFFKCMFYSQVAWVCIQVLPLSSFVTLSTLISLNFSVPVCRMALVHHRVIIRRNIKNL